MKILFHFGSPAHACTIITLLLSSLFLFLLQNGGFSPVGGTTFFPQSQSQPAYTSVSNPPPPTDISTSTEQSQDYEEEKESRSSQSSSPPSTPNEKKASSDSNQLAEQVKQLSLDSAYTSEADLENSTSSSPQEGPSTPQEAECSGDEKVADHNEPPPDISRIVVKRSPPSALRSSQARYPKYTPSHHHGHHYVNNGLYYGPGYVPGAYAYPYTPQAAIQTIGPMYHNQ